MRRRIAPGSTIAWRVCVLVLSLGTMALVGEKTPTFASHPYYKIRNLNTLHPDPMCPTDVGGQMGVMLCLSRAEDVSIWGVVVGFSLENPNPPATLSTLTGFRTGPNKAIVPTDALVPNAENTNSQAFAVNDHGRAVGGSYAGSDDNQALLWPLMPANPSQIVISLGTGWPARAVNNSGVVVGGGIHAWIGYSHLQLPATGTQSAAHDINDHGIVVGTHTLSGVTHAVRWKGALLEDLGTLNPSCPACTSAALAVNHDGVIVGSSHFDASPRHHAFLWPVLFGPPPFMLGMADLGTLCSADDNHLCDSSAEDINSHGHVVGYSHTTSSDLFNRHAFLRKGVTMKDLNTLLSPADQANWVLQEAMAINDLGQIAGTGLFQGNKLRAFLLTPPLHAIFDLTKDLTLIFAGEFFSGDQGLRAKLAAAEVAFGRGNVNAAHHQLDAFDNQVEALVRTRRLDEVPAMKLHAGTTLLRAEIESHGREQ